MPMYRRLLALASFALLALACNSTNPVEPGPNTPGGSTGGGSGVVVTLKSDRGQVEAGSTQGATLTVTALQNGAPVADGLEVALSTSLGNFGVDGAGKPLQLVTKALSGGSATVTFYGGATPGTANILAQVGTSLGKLNVPVVSPAAPPVADFTMQISALSVLFTDTSTGTPTAWAWDFGDGATTTKQSPLHTYAFAGTFTVSLTVTNASGLTSTKRQFATVEAGDPLLADFTYTVNGLTVLFADASAGTPISYRWDFGDGKSSTLRNPNHTYARAGTYTVTLTIANAFGVTDGTSQFVTLTLGDPPKADFTVQTDGLRALFTDTSTGGPVAWTWDFGDGTSSSAQSPQHAYAQAGTYNVTLSVSNSGGTSSKSKFVTVSLGDPPKAAFTFQANGLKVVFVDGSTGGPTGWNWDFGDGTTSTQQNPTHTYANAGSYTVVLTATNAAGASQATHLVTVATSTPPAANFCYQRNKLAVIFTDISTPAATSWAWDFGDCTPTNPSCQSAAQNPGHSYAAPGTFAVTLTATNAAGQGSRSKFVTVDNTTVDASPICN